MNLDLNLYWYKLRCALIELYNTAYEHTAYPVRLVILYSQNYETPEKA